MDVGLLSHLEGVLPQLNAKTSIALTQELCGWWAIGCIIKGSWLHQLTGGSLTVTPVQVCLVATLFVGHLTS